MIDYEQFCHIKDLQTQQGLKPPQIAQVLDLDPRTVAKWVAEDHYRPRQPTQRPSQLDPFKPDIVRMLERYPYSATQIFDRICALGFSGSYSIVKRYVRTVRPRRPPAFLTLSFAPGECAQVDWGSFGSVPVGSTRRRLSFFVMVLCYSRMLYVECTVAQTMEHFLACHQHAFEFLHAVPHKIMVDNLKSAVLKRALGQAPVLNPKYLEFAQHYGFSIAPCNVGQAHEKGRVENAVGYVKKNFLAGLDIPDFSALGPALRHWLDTVANVRSHGETKQKPVDLLEQERLALRRLPSHPFDIATVSPVRASRQFRITLDTNRYSVPAQYAGQPLTLKTYPDRLCLYAEENLIARHPRSYDRHQDFEDPDHPKALLLQRKKARDQKLFLRFLALSTHADAYYRKLQQRRINPLHHVRNIVALSEIYPPQTVARALEDALSLGAFSSEYIANLLQQRARTPPQPGALHLTRREDLLDVTVEPPDLTVYQTPEDPTPNHPGGGPHDSAQPQK